MIEFFVPGKAAPGGSKKGFYNKKLKRVMMVPDCDKTKPWMNTVAFFARNEYRGELLEGPLKLTIEFRRLRLKGHYGTGCNSRVLKKNAPAYAFTRPDLTKLVRSTEDALKGIIWRDDSQVVIQATRKIYVDRDPGAMIRISKVIEDKNTSTEKSLFEE